MAPVSLRQRRRMERAALRVRHHKEMDLLLLKQVHQLREFDAATEAMVSDAWTAELTGRFHRLNLK